MSKEPEGSAFRLFSLHGKHMKMRRTGGRTPMAVMAATALLASTSWASATGPRSDAQGWGGPGWYISDTPMPAAALRTAPTTILFEGPHDARSDCIEMYDRLYSPIGICRYLAAKPGIRG
jgi:hypothetical protein